MKFAACPALLLALLICCESVAARSPSDSGARVEAVAPDVYAIIHDDATDEWPHGNTGVIVGSDGLIVIDSTYLPSRARADIALIRQLSDKPVRYLVNTHWHFDHNNGAIAYQEAYPGVTIVSERETREFIVLNARYWARMSTAPKSSRRAALAALEQQLERGKDGAGKVLTAEARSRLEKTVKSRRGELEELATLTPVAPNLVFDRQLTLELGGRQVQLHDWGPANSPHDVTVYLPQEKVLFTGDILVQAPVPYFVSSWPVPWASVLKNIESIPVAAVVPGHGPVMRDHTYTREVRLLLESVISQVTRMANEGLTLEQVKAAIDVNAERSRVPAWNSADTSDWKLVLDGLVERVWRGVRGQNG